MWIRMQVGECFHVRWTLQSRVAHVLNVRVLVSEGASTPEGALVFGGAKETLLQILPGEDVQLPLALVSVVTGPVALPKLTITPLGEAPQAAASASPGAEAQAAPLKICYLYVDNATSGVAQALEPKGPVTDTRHVFILPSAPPN
jgi:hypothetical protein